MFETNTALSSLEVFRREKYSLDGKIFNAGKPDWNFTKFQVCLNKICSQKSMNQLKKVKFICATTMKLTLEVERVFKSGLKI